MLPPPPPPRPGGPATLAQRFTETVTAASSPFNYEEGPTSGEVAWSLILDAWRVIEVASARGCVPATANREEWLAALRVAIFRAEHPDAPEVMPDGS